MKARLIWEGKIMITEKEGIKLTNEQRRDIIEAMNMWLSHQFSRTKLMGISPHNELVKVEIG